MVLTKILFHFIIRKSIHHGYRPKLHVANFQIGVESKLAKHHFISLVQIQRDHFNDKKRYHK